MPTYNGSTIVTGTLYEDGTIEVRPGFKVEPEMGGDVSALAIQGSRSKAKYIFGVDQIETTMGEVSRLSPLGSRSKQKIIVATDQVESEYGEVSGLSILGSRQKTVIVVAP